MLSKREFNTEFSGILGIFLPVKLAEIFIYEFNKGKIEKNGERLHIDRDS